MVVDAPPVAVGQGGTDILAHVVREFDGTFGSLPPDTEVFLLKVRYWQVTVGIIVVIGSPRMNVDLQRRFAQERTKTGEPITVLMLDKSSGVADRDEHFMQLSREAAIKEYFFGDAKRTLSPFTQSLGVKDLVIYTAPDREYHWPWTAAGRYL
jgi:polyribonucleotide 5'-hydroxyl-kinase